MDEDEWVSLVDVAFGRLESVSISVKVLSKFVIALNGFVFSCLPHIYINIQHIMLMLPKDGY